MFDTIFGGFDKNSSGFCRENQYMRLTVSYQHQEILVLPNLASIVCTQGASGGPTDAIVRLLS